MPRGLTNKQIAVLELLREKGELTAKEVGEILTERTPCGACSGTGEGDDTRWGCRRCYGRGQAHFDYSTAYQCLKRLMGKRLVMRRAILDPWGDDSGRQVYSAVAQADPADPLEKLWAAS